MSFCAECLITQVICTVDTRSGVEYLGVQIQLFYINKYLIYCVGVSWSDTIVVFLVIYIKIYFLKYVSICKHLSNNVRKDYTLPRHTFALSSEGFY